MNGENSDKEGNAERARERRRKQIPGPPYRTGNGTFVEEDRRIRPDPRLDKLIEVEWEDEESSTPGEQDQS